MAVFLKVPSVTGGATEDKHKGWIKIDSLQFGVSRAISTPTGAATSRETSHPNISELMVSKSMDESSIELFGWSVSKFDAKQLKVDVCATGRDDPVVTYTYENAVISGYSISASDDTPMESLSFNFTKVEVKYVTVSADMKTTTPSVKGYDIATQKAS